MKQHYTCELTVVIKLFCYNYGAGFNYKNYLCFNNFSWGNLSCGSICPKLNDSNYVPRCHSEEIF